MRNNSKFLRKSRGYIQISPQMQTGIEQALPSKYENRERISPTEPFLKSAELYRVSMDDILCPTENPEINR